MKNSQDGMNALKAAGVSIAVTKRTISQYIDGLALGVNFITNNITEWSSIFRPIPAFNTISYVLTAPVLGLPNASSTASQAQSNIKNAADGNSTFSTLYSSPNLTLYSIEISNLVTNLELNIRIRIKGGGDSVKSSSTTALNSGEKTVSQLLNNMTSSINGNIDSARNTTVQYFPTVSNSVVGVWILSALLLIVFIVLSILMMMGKPSAVKRLDKNNGKVQFMFFTSFFLHCNTCNTFIHFRSTSW